MYIIGELINGMYRKVAQAIVERNKTYIKSLAQLQIEAGADALDVNCGLGSKNAGADMRWLVETIQDGLNVRLSLDYTKPEVIEECLKVCRKSAIINSSSADIERLSVYLPMAKKYNASLIVLAMDQNGVPQDKDKKLELAVRILNFAQEHDFSLEELYLDPILPPINVAQNQLFGILEGIKDFKMLSTPAPKTVVGLSNVSQGVTDRSIINRTFFVMARACGLDAAILDPLDEALMHSVITAELILNKTIYCDSFLDAYRKSKNRQ